MNFLSVFIDGIKKKNIEYNDIYVIFLFHRKIQVCYLIKRDYLLKFNLFLPYFCCSTQLSLTNMLFVRLDLLDLS